MQGGNLLGEAFFGVEIKKLFIKKNAEVSQYTLKIYVPVKQGSPGKL